MVIPNIAKWENEQLAGNGGRVKTLWEDHVIKWPIISINDSISTSLLFKSDEEPEVNMKLSSHFKLCRIKMKTKHNEKVKRRMAIKVVIKARKVLSVLPFLNFYSPSLSLSLAPINSSKTFCFYFTILQSISVQVSFAQFALSFTIVHFQWALCFIRSCRKYTHKNDIYVCVYILQFPINFCSMFRSHSPKFTFYAS